MLEHLVLYPEGGLCNRMRAIASAKRLCAHAGARCTIAWDSGDYRALFDDDTDWFPYDPRRDYPPHDYHYIRQPLQREGGNRYTRQVPVADFPKIALMSHFVFSACGEEALGDERDVFAWFPKPNPIVLEKAEVFRQSYMAPRQGCLFGLRHSTPKVAGFHMRRADHVHAIANSPDESFLEEADQAVSEGFLPFLATDNAETLRMMRLRYGSNLLYRRKKVETEQRWPRQTLCIEDFIDDMVDLWLLAACEYVIGCADSSYSRVAILLNGSPQCRVVRRETT